MPSKQKSSKPSPSAIKEAGLIVELLKKTLSAEEFEAVEHGVMDPEARAAQAANEQVDRDLSHLFEELMQAQAGKKLTSSITKKWGKLLDECEHQIKELYKQQPDAPERWELTIKRGWVVADEEAKKSIKVRLASASGLAPEIGHFPIGIFTYLLTSTIQNTVCLIRT